MGQRKIRLGAVVVGVLCCLTLVAGAQVQAEPPPLADGAPGGQHAVSAGAEWTVWSPGPGMVANYPQTFATDVVVDGVTRKKVFTYWNNTVDGAAYATAGGLGVSSDNGLTFDTSRVQGSVTGGTRLDDGSLLAAHFLLDQAGPTTFRIKTSRSTDLGATWTDGWAPLDPGKYRFSWLRVHRGFVRTGDGTLLMPLYGRTTTETVDSSFLAASTDSGASWTVRSRISDADKPGTNETAIAHTSDGRLIAFLRNVNEVDLMQAYSDDDGRTWTKPTVIVVPSGAPTGLADPGVVLQPNGMLVLTYGRPDNTVLVSRDGTGRTWDDYENVFVNKPRQTWPGNTHGSSGNTSIANVGANRSMVFGDTCGHQWMCREKGQQYRIWARRVDAVTPGTGKIDLAAKVRAGTVKLAGTVTPADPAFPETRLEGAVDGSAERYAAARLTGKPELTITLDRAYRLNRVGLMLGYGLPQDADVAFSVDGEHWDRPVVKARNSTDFALRYQDFRPTWARYVKITGPKDRLAAVTELELYSADTLTFENDATNAPPRGFVDTRYAFVNDTIMSGATSGRWLSLVDADGDAAATATLPTRQVGAQRLDYAYAATQYASGMRMLVRGKDPAGNDVNPWQFTLVPSGPGFKLTAFDGTAWRDVGVTRTRPPNQVWTTVRIDTTRTTATITIGGETLTTTVRAAEAKGFTGVTFDTAVPNTPVQSGMQHDFDDIQVTALD
ncbi:exo-alpha-sialidase [Actinophytocola sp.]|uniref:exo-alpha-sialidase n=1 Tax=Actinophytocola sp. TaxID=1872138 RepID=UPI002EDA7F90